MNDVPGVPARPAPARYGDSRAHGWSGFSDLVEVLAPPYGKQNVAA